MKKTMLIAASTAFFTAAYAQKPYNKFGELQVESYFRTNPFCNHFQETPQNRLNVPSYDEICRFANAITLPKSGEFIVEIYWWSRKVGTMRAKGRPKGTFPYFDLYEFDSFAIPIYPTINNVRLFEICNRQQPIALVAICDARPLIFLNPRFISIWSKVMPQVCVRPFEIVAKAD